MNINNLKKEKWFGGQLLAYSGIDGPTDYENGITARTSHSELKIEVVFPGQCTINLIIDKPYETLISGDTFQLISNENTIKGAYLNCHHILIAGNCKINNECQNIKIKTANDRTLVGSTKHFDPTLINTEIDLVINERNQWLNSIHLNNQNQYLNTFMKCCSIMKTQIYSPEGKIKSRWSTPDRWPHKDMWLWDSVFHALGWRHLDKKLAQELIDAVLDSQLDDGFIPHQIKPNGNSKITQPPILAFGAYEIYSFSNDIEWLKNIYEKLSLYLNWNLINRDSNNNGLVEWYIDSNPLCRSGESGMDNSPRFDEAHQLDAVDFNSYMSLEYKTMAKIADILGKLEDKSEWQNKHENLNLLIRNNLWSNNHQFFMDYDLQNKKFSNTYASSGFLPLICGAASKTQAQYLIEKLLSPKYFGATFPVPSISKINENVYSKDMWRGPTWININWFIAFGLKNYGFIDHANQIISKSIEIIDKYCKKHNLTFEYYDDQEQLDPLKLLRKGECNPEKSPYHQVLQDYGWTATLFVDMVINNT